MQDEPTSDHSADRVEIGHFERLGRLADDREARPQAFGPLRPVAAREDAERVESCSGIEIGGNGTVTIGKGGYVRMTGLIFSGSGGTLNLLGDATSGRSALEVNDLTANCGAVNLNGGILRAWARPGSSTATATPLTSSPASTAGAG